VAKKSLVRQFSNGHVQVDLLGRHPETIGEGVNVLWQKARPNIVFVTALHQWHSNVPTGDDFLR
jgi:hypothetical protein